MRREIKFRAWLKSEEIMVTPCVPLFNNLYSTFAGIRIKEISRIYTNTEVVLMQFTGLKDKNGKEIFEGDILRNDTVKSQLVEIYSTKDDVIGAFGYAFKFRKLPNEKDLTWRMDMDKVEVIGNIMENKELLDEA